MFYKKKHFDEKESWHPQQRKSSIQFLQSAGSQGTTNAWNFKQSHPSLPFATSFRYYWWTVDSREVLIWLQGMANTINLNQYRRPVEYYFEDFIRLNTSLLYDFLASCSTFLQNCSSGYLRICANYQVCAAVHLLKKRNEQFKTFGLITF